MMPDAPAELWLLACTSKPDEAPVTNPYVRASNATADSLVAFTSQPAAEHGAAFYRDLYRIDCQPARVK